MTAEQLQYVNLYAACRGAVGRGGGRQGPLFRYQSVGFRQAGCGTCHVPSHAFTADPATDHGLPVPLGGPNMDQTGFRNAPSLMYASFTPPFSLADGPAGGFFRDGRASSLATQAQQPFVTAVRDGEPRTPPKSWGGCRTRRRPCAAFVAAYGEAALSDPDTALEDMGLALAAYETEDPGFHPFSSKYDYWLQGQAQLTAQEQSGLDLFNNPDQGQLHRLPSRARRRATTATRCSPISPSTISACRATGAFRQTPRAR